jgi:hypothetical protein
VNSTARRIGVLMLVFSIATAVVLLQLGWLMLGQNETWTLRSYMNRWTFRDVPTHRGAILDRDGRVLVADAPSFELLVDYQEFRRYHPVGAAVHGATLLADYTPALAGVRYTYGPGPRGPEQACQALLDLPLQWLQTCGSIACRCCRTARTARVRASTKSCARPSGPRHCRPSVLRCPVVRSRS